MRFDDSLATVLRALATGNIGHEAAWRQLVDLLAQGRDGERVDDAVRALTLLRDEVSPENRAAVAASYAHRAVSPRLVAWFAGDRLPIAAALLGSVRLTAAEWLELVPQLGSSQRALLRHRRDLGTDVERALASFGAADLIVEGTSDAVSPAESVHEAEPARVVHVEVQAPAQPEVAPAPAPAPGEQIRELLDRIETFRHARNEAQHRPADPEEEAFSFETDATGTIVWIEGVPRSAVIGGTIATPAEVGEAGVDGQAAGAFRRRAPFRNARLAVGGSGPAGGDWRISAVPFFEPVSGRFSGYRGSARRPRRDEVAADTGSTAVFGGGLSPDSLRQLVHELRTPLNAIQGFADMIEGQMLGPASSGYRHQAGEIATQARRLLGAVEDLDTAARIETDRLAQDAGHVDGAILLHRLYAEYQPLARENEVSLRFILADDLPFLQIAPAPAERLLARLIGAALGLARRGEAIEAEYGKDALLPGGLMLTLSRPAALAGFGETELLDPGFSPAGDWPDAPVLGLGFALRLVSNLARANGGRFAILPHSFVLHLPGIETSRLIDRQSG